MYHHHILKHKAQSESAIGSRFWGIGLWGTNLWMAGLCLHLCACSTTSETFDCKAGTGVGCKSISEVNQLLDQGGLHSNSQGGLREMSEEDKQSRVLSSSPPIMVTDSKPVEGIKPQGTQTLWQQKSPPISDGLAVSRIPEEHLKVWMAPFQDEQGNLHEGSVVHTVFKPGYWQLNPQIADPSAKDSQVKDPLVGNSIIKNLEEVS